MVKTITSFGRSGLQDWIIQRASALILLGYSLFWIGYSLFKTPLNYDRWHGLHSVFEMKIVNTLVLAALLAHAWIGVWIISTDYVKAGAFRIGFQFLIILALSLYCIAGLQIIWSL